MNWIPLDKNCLPEKELLVSKEGSNSWIIAYVYVNDSGDLEAESEHEIMEEPTHYFDPMTLKYK